MEETPQKTSILKAVTSKADQAKQVRGNLFNAATQGLRKEELQTLVDEINAKGEGVTDFEAGLRSVAKSKIRDIET